MPLVSVIIPVYNREYFIEEAIHSVRKQTFRDYELIVVDDHSTDDSVKNAERFGVRVMKSEGRGVSAARNTGIRYSKGRWLAFLDSDDLWYENKLSEQMEYHRANPSTLISYTEETWYRKGKLVNQCAHHKKYSGRIFMKLLPLCLISPSSVMIRRDVLMQRGVFNEEYEACEDYDLWLRLSLYFEIHLIEKELIIKRNGHPGQLSATVWGQDRFRIKSIKNIMHDKYLEKEEFKFAAAVLKKKCLIYAQGAKKRGRLQEAQEILQLLDENY